MDFRAQVVFGSVQISKTLFNFITPYLGYKAIICDKDTDFEWGTSRSVSFRGNAYPMGMDYKSAGNDGAAKLYHEVYGGLGIFRQFITLGAAYNFITEHAGVNVSVKLSGIGPYQTPESRPAAEKPPKKSISKEEKELREAEESLRKEEASLAQSEEQRERDQKLAERREELRKRQEEVAEKSRAEALERAAREKEARKAAEAERAAKKAELNEKRSAVVYTGGIKYGDLLLRAGLGLGVPLRGRTTLPPLMVTADYALPLFGQPFTVGGMAAVSGETGGYDSTHISAAFRLAWHPGFLAGTLPHPLDLYAAAVLGAGIGIGKKSTANVLPGVLIGAHWFFTDWFGAYMELGYTPLYIFGVGAAFKL
jgi:hypothetical protein